jgi:hypothetical protein
LCIYSLIFLSYHFSVPFLTAAERRGIIPPEIKSAIRGAKTQGANTVLLEIVTPDLSWEIIEPTVKKMLGAHVRKAPVYWEGRLYSILK